MIPTSQGRALKECLKGWKLMYLWYPGISWLRGKLGAGTVFPCDGHCLRAFHLGLDESETDSGQRKLTYNDCACNPLGMPEDLARRLNVSMPAELQKIG